MGEENGHVCEAVEMSQEDMDAVDESQLFEIGEERQSKKMMRCRMKMMDWKMRTYSMNWSN